MRTSGDHQYYSIDEIGQNTEKSPRDLRRLVVTQNPSKNDLLTLVWKNTQIRKLIMIIIIMKMKITVTKNW